MGLPTALSFLRTGTGGQTLDVYLDPLCPFSAKMARSLHANIVPEITSGGKYDGQLQLIIRLYAQPFHYFSSYSVEAIMVFGNQYPELFWDYFLAVLDIQDQWFNRPAASKTPEQMQQAYVDVGLNVLEKAGKLPQGPRSQAAAPLLEKLQVHEKNNGGSSLFNEFKYLIKEGRQNGIHVTPTVLVNGLKDDSISSSFGKAEWDKFLANVSPADSPSAAKRPRL